MALLVLLIGNIHFTKYNNIGKSILSQSIQFSYFTGIAKQLFSMDIQKVVHIIVRLESNVFHGNEDKKYTRESFTCMKIWENYYCLWC